MDTDTLKTLQEVATGGSFAAVARARGVDPSNVSRTVAQAEAQLGFRLFQRSTRAVQPTEAGALYLARIAPLLEELDQARDAAAQVVAQPAGRVRLTASVAFGTEVIVPLLPGLRAALPEVSLEMVLSDENVDLLAGQIDIALRLAPAPKGDLISVKLMDTGYRVVASQDYLARHGRPTGPQDLSAHEVLRMTLPDHRAQWQFRRDGVTAAVPVSGPLLMSNVLALRAAACAGLGPALLADWLVAEDLAAGRLVDLFPGHAVAASGFETAAWLLYPSRAYLPRKVRVVIDYLRGALG